MIVFIWSIFLKLTTDINIINTKIGYKIIIVLAVLKKNDKMSKVKVIIKVRTTPIFRKSSIQLHFN
jgi:hypothetical protein